MDRLKVWQVMQKICQECHLRLLLEGAVMLVCGDCDRILEKIRLLLRLAETWNDGKPFRLFLLSDFNPTIDYVLDKEARTLLDKKIRRAKDLKGLKNIILHGHGPCSNAGSYNLSLEGNIGVTAKAIPMMQEEHCSNGGEVGVLFHTDPTDQIRDMRTYLFDRGEWDSHHMREPALLSSTSAELLLPSSRQ